ncbi:E3 ubiquitin-protein ligase RNF31, partial [Orchesella cincta]
EDEQKKDKDNTEVKTEDANDEKGVTEETPAQRLITEGKATTLKQAELALQLFEMNFNEEDALCAAKECVSLCSALSYLQQECDLCTGKFSATEMVSMLRCTHLCCRTCARDYFTVQVRDKTIVDATCPFCAEPSTLSDDAELATEYFNHLDILLKNLLDSKQHEMFQRKLRDWTLAKTPNFKWCSKCSSGFITEPMQTRLVCPDCKAVTCAVCMETWDKVNHDHRDRDSTGSMKLCDAVPKSIIEYLNANCIECPRCHFRFSLARGGCMHLTCTQCHHEFCSGCAAPFRMGEKCEAKFPICDRLGLHAHHPRNCLFYLRDKEPDVLAKLLEENAIPYFKENSGEDQLEPSPSSTSEPEPTKTESGDDVDGGDENANTATTTTTPKKKPRLCQVPVQKETNDGFVDEICGKEAPEGYATVCKIHYIEYLGLLIWQNHLDPITILTNEDLEVIIRRAYKKHPGRPNWLSDEGFRKRLLKPSSQLFL